MEPGPSAAVEPLGAAPLDLAGEALALRADRSVFWPGAATLFVADTHFGKADVFRRQGLGVPSGTTAADLARLTAAVAATAARRLVILGDFAHAPPAPDTPWLAQFAAWRYAHPDIEIMVTRGNHDRIDRLSGALGVGWHAGSRWIAPFVCRHAPGADARGPVLAGHVHPTARLVDGGERLRLPVFWAGPGGLVLPAFSSFAGGARVVPAAGEQVFAVAGDRVLAVSAGG